MDDTKNASGSGGISPQIDGTLVRVLDGELSGTSEKEAQTILDSSLEARLRLEELWINSDLFSEHLADLSIPPTPVPHFLFGDGVPESVLVVETPDMSDKPATRTFTFPTLTVRHRIAAGIVLLLLSMALITPVRAWIVEEARSLVSILTTSEERSDSSADPEGRGSAVSFVPVGSEFLVTVEAHQSSGRLTIVVVRGSRASGEVSGGDSQIELLVLPAGIEIRNEPGSVVGYTVEVPRSIDELRVRVGGTDLGIRSLESVEIGQTWVFELAAPRG